jgi:hypothetical protein
MRFAVIYTLASLLALGSVQALPADSHDAAIARDTLLGSRGLEADLGARDAHPEAEAEPEADGDGGFYNTALHHGLAARQAAGQRCPAGLRAVSKGVAAVPNGCGTKGFKVPNFDFGACCNAHDRCYANCAMSRRTCDSVFTGCMANTCINKYQWFNPVRALCLNGAATYGAAVTLGGEGAYDKATIKHCRCVK